jgi:hypothetical protein
MNLNDFIVLPSARFLVPLQAVICHELVRLYGTSSLTLPTVSPLLQPLREPPTPAPSPMPSSSSASTSSYDVKQLSKTELTIGEGWSYAPPPLSQLFPAQPVVHPSIYASSSSSSSSSTSGNGNGGMFPTLFPGALRRSQPSWYYIASQTTLPSSSSGLPTVARSRL